MMRAMVEARALEEQADRAAAAGQFAAARSLLEQAAEGGSTGFSLWLKLSAMRKASGDLRGALAAVDRALALSPLDFSALLSRATILDGLGDPAAGEEFGNALAQLPPGSPRAFRLSSTPVSASGPSASFPTSLGGLAIITRSRRTSITQRCPKSNSTIRASSPASQHWSRPRRRSAASSTH